MARLSPDEIEKNNLSKELYSIRREIDQEVPKLEKIREEGKEIHQQCKIREDKCTEEEKELSFQKEILQKDRDLHQKEWEDKNLSLKGSIQNKRDIDLQVKDAQKELNWILDKIMKEEKEEKTLQKKNEETQRKLQEHSQLESLNSSLITQIEENRIKLNSIILDNQIAIDSGIKKMKELIENARIIEESVVVSLHRREKLENDCREMSSKIAKERKDLIVMENRIQLAYSMQYGGSNPLLVSK